MGGFKASLIAAGCCHFSPSTTLYRPMPRNSWQRIAKSVCVCLETSVNRSTVTYLPTSHRTTILFVGGQLTAIVFRSYQQRSPPSPPPIDSPSRMRQHYLVQSLPPNCDDAFFTRITSVCIHSSDLVIAISHRNLGLKTTAESHQRHKYCLRVT